MKYQISYLSPSGSCRMLAEAFSDILDDVYVTDLKHDNQVHGDVHLVGFEMDESSFKVIPYQVLDFLDHLSDKTFLLFVTCPFEAGYHTKLQLEKAISPFFPEKCDYRGLHLCLAEASEGMLSRLQSVCQQYPDDQRKQALLESCRVSVGHPDGDDIMKACIFVAQKLELD